MTDIYEGLVVLNDGTDRESWLKARLSFITATQAAAIAGSHPYTKLIDVWNEKTDPDYNTDHLKNRWLEERAANGTEREPEILQWMSALPVTGGAGNPFEPSGVLLTLPEHLETFPEFPPAATPDGAKLARAGALVLAEAKTSEQDWKAKGLPQHVYDQCQWQIYATGAVTVWVAQERYTWEGRGAKRHAVLADTWVTSVQRDDHRLEFLLAKVAEFRQWLADGIAPESDIILTEPVEFSFDDTEEETAAKVEQADLMAQWDADLAELREIRETWKMPPEVAKREAELEARIKAAVKQYDGRRVHLVGTQFIAKLVRFPKATVDLSQIPETTLRSITNWPEQERVAFEPNPEYQPAINTESESPE